MYVKSWCPYCDRARELLRVEGCRYRGDRHRVAARAARGNDPSQRAQDRTADLHRRRHIGGSRRVHELDAAGGLDPLLQPRTHSTSFSDKVYSNGQCTSPAGGPKPSAASTTLVLQGVYLKDCSFEAPQGPRGNGEWNPQISLDLNTTVQPLAGDVREILLTVTVSAKQARADAVPGRGQTGRRVRDAESVGGRI